MIGKSGVNSKVVPSGALLLTWSTAKRAPAPGLFSTNSPAGYADWMRLESARAATSLPPPAGNPTTIRAIRVGCADALPARNGAHSGSAESDASWKVLRVIIGSP